MPYLVDTDILIDFFRKNEPAIDYLDSLGDWSLSVITGLELIAGAKDKREVAEIRQRACHLQCDPGHT